MPEVLSTPEDYGPVPDLALLLGAVLRGGRDGSAYAERVAVRLGLDEDDDAETVTAELRNACRCPGAGYAEAGSGTGADGTPWAVEADGGGMIVSVGREDVLLKGAERDRFAEAVARAVTPGQTGQASRSHPDGYGGTATCKHCRKPIARCATLPGHAGCRSGYGWIHSDPEQWGHTCQPRSGAPYALPSPSTEAAQAAGTEG